MLNRITEKLFNRDKKVTPQQQILDDLVLLKIKREQIQELLLKGQPLGGALTSVNKEIVSKVAEYKRTLVR